MALMRYLVRDRNGTYYFRRPSRSPFGETPLSIKIGAL